MKQPITASTQGDTAVDTPTRPLDVGGLQPPAPVVWLIGKVQSGKTSIVRTITNSTEAEIGSGFKACTRTARVFDFPPSDAILRFLDTRGLGEASYDPADDLAFAERQAHLLLVVMRAMDMSQDAVIDVVTTARRSMPKLPVVVAQTTLHEGYGARGRHFTPYPFTLADVDLRDPPALPADLLRALRQQRLLFRRVRGKAPIVFVPIDFTLPGDGLEPADYGIDALGDALLHAAPEAMRAIIEAMPGLAVDGRIAASEPLIRGHAVAAAGSDLVPVAGAVAVSAVQMRLLQRIGQLYGVSWDRRTSAEFAGALGAGVAARTLVGFGVRQLAKLIPVYGQTAAAAASAATSFAVTFALGKAAVHFLGRRQRGLHVAGTARAYQQGLRDALRQAKRDTPAAAGSRPPT